MHVQNTSRLTLTVYMFRKTSTFYFFEHFSSEEILQVFVKLPIKLHHATLLNQESHFDSNSSSTFTTATGQVLVGFIFSPMRNRLLRLP